MKQWSAEWRVSIYKSGHELWREYRRKRKVHVGAREIHE